VEIYGSFQFPSNFNRSRPAANFANNESRMAHTASAERGNMKRDAVGVRETRKGQVLCSDRDEVCLMPVIRQ
jgi:hypothetical protein